MGNNRRVTKHFQDETTLQICLKNAEPTQVRSLIPSSACILDYSISKNYVKITWSEEAKEQGYPDATDQIIDIEESKVKLYTDGKLLKFVTNFAPFAERRFLEKLQGCTWVEIERVRTYENNIGVVIATFKEGCLIYLDELCKELSTLF